MTDVNHQSKGKTMSSTLPKLIGFLSILILLGGFGTWAFLARIDGAIISSGRIVVDRNRQAVQHPDGGVVDEILVAEGDMVQAGTVLVRLDPTLVRSELTIVEGQLFELIARRGRLEAERDDKSEIAFDPFLLEQAKGDAEIQSLMDGQIRLFEARRDSLEKSVTQLSNQRQQLQIEVSGIDAQMKAAEMQLHLIVEETETQEFLMEKGLAQKSRLLNLRREDARLEGLTGALTSGRAQAMQQISELSIQELRLLSQRREDAISILRDLQFNEMEMAERREALLTRLDRMNVKSPVAGIVHDVQLNGTRSVVRPADSIMFVIPQDRPLLIEAEISPVDVDKVFRDQEVILRFATFDMRTTPDLFGRVLQVSPDAFVNSQSGLSYYQAEIELPKAEVEKLAADQNLIPGMPVELFMRTGEYTPAEFLASPLTQFFQRAMRDNG